MERLPLELVQQVFTHLDLASLRNVALSCRDFFNAFKSAEVLITSDILLRQIDLDVLPEAILVNESRHLGEPSVDKGTRFANDYLKSRTSAPLRWKLVDALPLERFHKFVHYLAALFAGEALERQPRLLALGEQPNPSCEEIRRFERALYRFQLFCNIVGELDPIEDEELREMFFDHFSAWENEQLACLHDFLVRVVAKPFNYLVDHDVTWGYLQVRYIDTYCSEYGQHILSQGLEMVYRLSKASTYQQWHALLSNGEQNYSEPYERCVFLNRAFQHGADRLPFFTLSSLSKLSEEDKELVNGRPFYEDPDRGPASMWEWAQRNELPGALIGWSPMNHLRQWGYPFWDLSRLQSAGLLGDPSIPGPRGGDSDLELRDYRTPERLANLEKSRQSRDKLWCKGATGWWSATDESKVVWPPGYRKDPVKRLSLDERVKRFLQNYEKKKQALEAKQK
ncbi:hypothetical protein F4779DRAFT_592003 [Xylariaceae sp. FL0662B]|nr:hypothetical protein F4779DRAFT_592003 [Xylariaceae sp. FL0662B]